MVCRDDYYVTFKYVGRQPGWQSLSYLREFVVRRLDIVAVVGWVSRHTV